MKFKFGISEKLIAAVILLIFILTVIAAVYSFHYQKELLVSEFDERARVLINSIASSSEYPVLTGNSQLLSDIGNAALQQKDMVYCEIKDNAGNAIFQGGERNRDNIRGYVASILTEKVASSADEMLFSGSPVAKRERIGEVYLAFSLSKLMERMARQRTVVALFIIIGICVIFLFITLLVKFILGKPIRELIEGTRRISSGDLTYKVIVKARDEIGALAESFNKMTDDLQKITVSRDDLVKEVRERQAAEEKLKEAYDRLKQAEAQLVQSAKMASIGQLAGGVAHEINNPLTGVLNNTQLIKMLQEQKKDFSAADFNELLAVIEESALRCKKITQSLLDFSRASTKASEPISMNKLVEKVSILIEHEMQLENIRIEQELDPELPLVTGDPQLLQQVIFDIIANAKWAIEKKSGKTGGLITIATASQPQKKTVTLSITDTGIGIPAQNIDKIFEPFFTTKAVGEGTGLGLSIVYGIVKEHSGSVEVNSEEGVGSVFKITLPAS